MNNSNGSSQTPLILQVAEVQVTDRNKVPFAERQKVYDSADAEKIFCANG
ncbi:MAG: hypothetical protein IPO78_01885 [Saprospiraceae bacterium]|nr:hypothetical protein [Saprospiraceae bacterium]MBK9222605.1 hypothetical protein [Saprospiraceae bacterium]MBK9720351.1 hypothetical protein [Saprospiraceae bacterium]